MECMYPHLLSTEDLKRILEERRLKIPNIDKLTRTDTMKIFNKFAVPKNQRPVYNKQETIVEELSDTEQNSKRRSETTNMTISPAKKVPCVTVTVKLNEAKKRPFIENIEPSESSPTKRKKITWP